MKNAMKALLHNSIITTVVLLCLLPVADHHHRYLAAAASGGRMGGTSFRSPSTSPGSLPRGSTSSYSRSYNIPRFPHSTRDSSSSTSSPESSSSDARIGRHLFGIEFGFLDLCIVVLSVGFANFFLLRRYAYGDRVETSVVKLQIRESLKAVRRGSEAKALDPSSDGQEVKDHYGFKVGLLGTARSLQKDLNHIAETVDTSSPTGFRYILKETILSVLKHPDYCISGYSSVEVKKGVDECEKRFNKLSIEERDKFDEETLVNFNNIRKQGEKSHEGVSDEVCNQYIVVTIIVAARGAYELPLIKSSELLKISLQKLASIPSNDVLAAEVLWTPQKENDCLTEQEMLRDYPFLCPI